MKHKIKLHRKRVENIAKRVPKKRSLDEIGSLFGTVDDLIALNHKFLKNRYAKDFYDAVCWAWLEHQFTYKGLSRGTANEQGFYPNQVYGYFMKHMVGVTQKGLTDNLFFTALSSYIPELFPTLYEHNPFDEPEYFKFPYRNIDAGHMSFVYQCDDRMAMLDHAEKVSMSYGDFRNWVINHVETETPGQYRLVFWHNSTYLRKFKSSGRYKTKE